MTVLLFLFIFVDVTEEGDAYGASLRQISSRPRAVVTLRASTCVDCHVIKLKDLADILRSYPNLRSQLLRMMDAADQNDLYDEVIYFVLLDSEFTKCIQPVRPRPNGPFPCIRHWFFHEICSTYPSLTKRGGCTNKISVRGLDGKFDILAVGSLPSVVNSKFIT